MTPPSPLDEPFLTDRLCYIIAEQNEIIKEQHEKRRSARAHGK